MECFWSPETLNSETHGRREMGVNVLARSQGSYNGVFGTYALRGYLVKISRAEGPPEVVWVEPESFKPWRPKSYEPTEDLTKGVQK